MSDLDPQLRAVTATNDEREANAWAMLLTAVQLPHRVVDITQEPLLAQSAPDLRYHLLVSVEDADRAQALLDAQREEDERARVDVIEDDTEVAATSPAAMTIGIALLLSLMYCRSPGFDGSLSPRLEI